MTAVAKGFRSRADLGLRQPRSVSNNITPSRGGACPHWGGPAPRIRSHADCETTWRGWQRFHMDSRGWVDIAYCVDEETEILTDHGWVNYSELREGDRTLTLNQETGLAEWQPVLEVCIFPAKPREMISMESTTHSSLTTPNHRWLVERSHRRTGRERQHDEAGHFVRSGHSRNEYVPEQGRDRLWVTSETFGYWDRVPIAADLADLPEEQKWSDAFVELIGWFWTEGHIHKHRDGTRSRNVSITQSADAVDNCERIRSALTRVFGPAVASMPRTGSGATDGVPRWREYVNGHKSEFWLNVHAGEIVQHQAPGRVLSHDWLLSLTRAQLGLLVETSMLADNSGPRSLAQKDRDAAEAFQFACILAGYATSLRPRKPTASTAYTMWQVGIRKRRSFMPYRLSNGERVVYDGKVWCPRTPNQTWLARRRGTVYFTGNTAGFCQHGIVLAGRGLGVRSAANGTNDGNRRFHAFVWIGGEGQTPSRDALNAFDWLVANARRHGAGWEVVPHRRFTGSRCPGEDLIRHAETRNGQAIGYEPAPEPEPEEDELAKLSEEAQEFLERQYRDLVKHDAAPTSQSHVLRFYRGVRENAGIEEPEALGRYVGHASNQGARLADMLAETGSSIRGLVTGAVQLIREHRKT